MSTIAPAAVTSSCLEGGDSSGKVTAGLVTGANIVVVGKRERGNMQPVVDGRAGNACVEVTKHEQQGKNCRLRFPIDLLEPNENSSPIGVETQRLRD